MNHPEKVYVAGSGMKNRYRTIIPSKLPILSAYRALCRILVLHTKSIYNFIAYNLCSMISMSDFRRASQSYPT